MYLATLEEKKTREKESSFFSFRRWFDIDTGRDEDGREKRKRKKDEGEREKSDDDDHEMREQKRHRERQQVRENEYDAILFMCFIRGTHFITDRH